MCNWCVGMLNLWFLIVKVMIVFGVVGIGLCFINDGLWLSVYLCIVLGE